ncbi:hypothetical protein AHAS_Ahas18G0210600 [Arachis hypogaea]
MYGKRNMWATIHIQRKFFVRFRTISRCESLHAVLKRYIKSRHNLIKFVQHFQRCLNYMQHRENLEDFKSSTKQLQIFMLFLSMLYKASTLKVIYEKESSYCKIYQVSKFYKPNMIWHVPCMRMVSINIPSSHILAILDFLDIAELPTLLVL